MEFTRFSPSIGPENSKDPYLIPAVIAKHAMIHTEQYMTIFCIPLIVLLQSCRQCTFCHVEEVSLQLVFAPLPFDSGTKLWLAALTIPKDLPAIFLTEETSTVWIWNCVLKLRSVALRRPSFSWDACFYSEAKLIQQRDYVIVEMITSWDHPAGTLHWRSSLQSFPVGQYETH